MKYDNVRPIIYVLVILIAVTLQEPWMVALQAAAGGFGLGAWMTKNISLRHS